MSEFELIDRYFTRATRHTQLSVGDDAALISVEKGMELAISTDMLVAGAHFFKDADPKKLGWKSLAVNLSDMAAMGAEPKWATLALALPEINDSWLKDFSSGFFACAETFNVDLIGGDTTRGPLTINVQIMGVLPAGKAIKRSGAIIGDDIWVSGSLGNAAFGLAHLQEKLTLPNEAFEICSRALHTPDPRVTLGLSLRELANSAIDLSDGLLADLGHILKASKVGGLLELKNIPYLQHSNFTNLLSYDELFHRVLAGGDDYELCFTAPTRHHAEIKQLSERLSVPLTCIGRIEPGNKLRVHGIDNEPLEIKEKGFDHFS